MYGHRPRLFHIMDLTYPIQNFLSYVHVSQNHKSFINSISKEEEPKNFDEAQNQPKWCETIKEEHQVLEKNDTMDCCTIIKK